MLLDNRYFNTQETAEGKLTLDICAISKCKPLTYATVKVFARDGRQRSKQLEELTVNRVGQTAEVRLGCPPRTYAQEPSDTKPYSVYDVEVVADGYVPMAIRGVQIFSDQTSVQEVILKPEGEHTGKHGEILINENTVWSDFSPPMTEDMIKPERENTGVIVLDEPMTPEYIVVHDGVPSSADAPNYFIKYKDYIKNVAASTIYPSWPVATIRANVLAIISFTLNRVFTDWYRHMGKNFTITSQAIYDNAYSYGRNTYTVISDIVDELFVNYISTKELRQPLLTRFTNEAKWKAKKLGDNEKTESEIIRQIVGRDVYLNTVVRIIGAPFTYPGYRLMQGASGEEVRIVQRQLNLIARYYPMIPRIVEDGVFSKNTEQAVCAFKKIFRIGVSGVVDFSVWHRISEVYVSVKRINEIMR